MNASDSSQEGPSDEKVDFDTKRRKRGKAQNNNYSNNNEYVIKSFVFKRLFFF